jgi:membrane-associated protease RseP (regulator of RpoE activity)
MERSYDLTRYDALIGRVLAIQDITVGDPEKDYIVRYRGRLRSEDTEATYDQLADQLKPFNVTPLFRWDGDLHAVLLIPSRPKPKASNARVNIIMFLLTVVSVSVAGVANSTITSLPDNFLQAALLILRESWPFTVSLLGILLTHEFGHYLMSRHHGVHATLPYFVPFLPPIGTMGAVIVMKEAPKNRRQLLDIGIAGPLAGLVVAIFVMIIGLSLSKLDALPLAASQPPANFLEGNSLLYLLLKFSVFGQLLPAPTSYGSMPQWLYWLRFFFTAHPIPLGGTDVMLHPVAFAGWIGLLVTALNLLPAGQLDGGHVIYVLIGKKNASRILPFLLGALVVLGFFWSGWWLWAVLIFFLGRTYDDPLDQITPLDPPRRLLAIASVIVFLVVFMPVPFTAF